MKKILIYISILILLAGCGPKNVSWEDAKDGLETLYKETIEKASSYDSYSVSQFKELFTSVSERALSLKEGIKEDEQEDIRSLYADNVLLRYLASESNSLESSKINTFSLNVEDLIKAAFEKADTFKQLQSDVSSLSEEISSWNDDNWALVEKKKTMKWAQVEDDYIALEEKTIDELPAPEDVDELQLEGYKNTIIDNYEAIEAGIDESNKANADAMYEAAVALREYTKDLEGSAAEKVYGLADRAIAYVKECYGEKISPASNFPTLASETKKWTLSVWNELVKLLNM